MSARTILHHPGVRSFAWQVLLIPGTSFMPCGSPSSHVRAAFSTATPEQIDAALSRLAGLLRQAQK